MIARNTVLLILVVGLSFLNGFSQENPNKEIVTLKTIVSLEGKPVVYQDRVKGGLHQTDGKPTEISQELVENSMLVTNTANNTTFRYRGETGTNDETKWEAVFIVTDFDASNSYAKGEIVVATSTSGQIQMFKANQDIAADESASNGNPFSNFDSWTPLGATTTFLDQNNNNHKQIVSGAQTIILANGNYQLPSAANVPGQTYIVKNKSTEANAVLTKQETSSGEDAKQYTVSISTKYQISVSTTNNETIDENSFSYYLYKKNDFITFISDGENWHYISKGGSEDYYLYPYPPAKDVDNIDAIYYGDRDENGNYGSGSYRVVCYWEGNATLYSVQRYSSGEGWQQTGSH